MTIKPLFFALALVSTVSSAQAEGFALEFEWGDLKLCTNGSPNRVENPTFTISNVPTGTKFIEFKMKDVNVPTYNHGGGTIEYTGQSMIEPGAFKYKSPCPPNGSHLYRWTAYAKESTGFFSDTIAEATSEKNYP